MKKGLFTLLLLISLAGFSQSTTISGLPQKNAASLSDTLIVQSGNTRRYTVQQIYDLIAGNFLTTSDLTSYEQSSHATATYATKTALNSYLLSSDAASSYVAKVAGKGLSTEDYTTTEKTKLAGIATGATNVTNNNQIANGAAYITSSALSPYELSSHASSTYATVASLNSYLLSTDAATTYATQAALSTANTAIAGKQPLSSKLTDIAASTLTISAASTLTLAYANDYVFNGTTAIYTLPAIDATKTGRHYSINIKNRGTGAITINTASGSTIYSNSAIATYTLFPGEAIELLPDGQFNNLK